MRLSIRYKGGAVQEFQEFCSSTCLQELLLPKDSMFVKRDHGPPEEGAASFHTTYIVMRAAQSQAQGGQSALAELCRLYWYPLYIFARRRGYSPEDAQDLTQGFFLHLLEHRALTRVNRLKGKFRSFLLASFQNHLSDAVGRARCLKRGGDKEFVQLDVEDAEERYRREPIEFLTFVPQVLPLLVCLHRSRQLVSRQPVRPLPELIRRQ